MRTKAICVGTALPAMVLAAHGCRAPTQVKLEVSTNVVCADMRGVDIVVAPEPGLAESRAALIAGGQRFASATTNTCSEGTPPRAIGSLVITPDTNAAAIVVIAAFGTAVLDDCKAPNFSQQCIVSRRRFGFVEHESLTLPVVLDPNCAGVPCTATSTCVNRRCVSSEVVCINGLCGEPGVLPDGGLEVVDGSSPFIDSGGGGGSDAGDGGNDATVPPDGGPFTGCPPGTEACIGNVQPVCGVPPPRVCCYGGGVTCTKASMCTGVKGCCGGADHCPGSEICCASTPTVNPTTTLTCKTRADCNALNGVVICSDFAQGCGAGFNCQTGSTPYMMLPVNAYFCNS